MRLLRIPLSAIFRTFILGNKRYFGEQEVLRLAPLAQDFACGPCAPNAKHLDTASLTLARRLKFETLSPPFFQPNFRVGLGRFALTPNAKLSQKHEILAF